MASIRGRNLCGLLVAAMAGGCAIKPEPAPPPPEIARVDQFHPNRCSADTSRPCSTDADCEAGRQCVSVLVTAADVRMRDGGHSARVGSRILWMFGDTVTATDMITDSAAWSSLSDPPRLHETVGENGPPLQFLPFTAEERAFNAAHANPPACCEKRSDCPAGDLYCHCPPEEADCAVRIALWPGDAASADRTGATVYYEKLVVGVAPFDFRQAGVGLARVTSGGSVAKRIPDGDGRPLLVFSADEPAFSRGLEVREAHGRFFYVYASVNRGQCAVDVLLARVPTAQLANRSAYEFWNGGGWSGEIDDAKPILSGAPARLGSVAWNPGIDLYVSAWSDACTGGSKVLIRAARRPEGAWSPPVSVDLAPLGATANAYYGLLHPELSARGELILSYFQPIGDRRGQVRLVRVELR